ncbi:MAG: DNA-processing protein DprA [Prevotellaceae bacterium]|nr:DNA-processing protein DprA [Prevotellaceae bacterium]
MTTEALNAIALSVLFGHRSEQLKQLYLRAGSATEIVDNAADLHAVAPDINERFARIDGDSLSAALNRAHKEAEFMANSGVRALVMGDSDYPVRLSEVCPDAPLVLYWRGNANLNAAHILSVVGTRHSTDYGRQMTERIIADLAAVFPDLIIVSGLAYGTDFNAHRAALDNNIATIGVLAHGLDRIYPSVHRNTATKMLNQGGLLTEYTSGVAPEKYNFLRRNRLVAALSEATIVIESKERGGALTTARLANEYALSVMALPGRAGDEASVGCNRLIAASGAQLVCSALDIVKELGWQPAKSETVSQPTLFDNDLSAEERLVLSHLSDEPHHFSAIVAAASLPVPVVLSVLSELEFRNLARQLPGSKWRRC